MIFILVDDAMPESKDKELSTTMWVNLINITLIQVVRYKKVHII